jgi:hypothetical protein
LLKIVSKPFAEIPGLAPGFFLIQRNDYVPFQGLAEGPEEAAGQVWEKGSFPPE